MSNQILTTMAVFLDSTNREIVKSAVGFIKLAVHTYPTDVIRGHLKQTLESLLGWPHGHRNHFKLQVRYICERLMRKFGYEELLTYVGDNEDGKKLLGNIKKRKEYAKKKKAKPAEQLHQVRVRVDSLPMFTLIAGPQTPGLNNPATASTFEEVLYGDLSESEAEGDEDGVSRGRKRGDVHGGSRLRNDNDQPMDLLDSVVTRVTSKLKPSPSILFNIYFRRYSHEEYP